MAQVAGYPSVYGATYGDPPQRGTTWRTLARVTATRASTWNTNSNAVTSTPVTASRATTWNVLVTAPPPTTVTATRGTTWTVRATLAVSRATGWATRTATAATRSTTWNVAAPAGTVTATRQTIWAVIGRVSTTRATSWGSLRTIAPATAATTWANLARVSAAIRGTTWDVFSNATTVASTRPGARLRVYLPNGADQGPIPTPQSVSASYPLNDVGGLTFDYALVAPRSNLLGQPCEIAIEYTPDNGVTWMEPDNSRFLYLSDSGNPLDRADKYSVSAKSYIFRLSTAPLLPRGLLNTDGKRPFLSANAGVILKTILNEAQADGFLTGLTHSSFTTTTDSAGAAWANTMTIYYEPGINYLTILQNLADQGFIDFKMSGRSLYVYNADTTLAVDRTVGVGQVTLRAGRDLTEAPYRRTWENLANFAFFQGDNATYSYTNPSATTPWGKQGIFISNGSVSDQGTMAALTQNELAQRDQGRIEYTRGLDFTRAASKPFWDYQVGDYVWSAVDGTGVVRLRIRQLTLSVNDFGILSGNVVLNDRFLEADVRAQRRIEGITNGASSGPGTGSTTPPVNSDTIAPSPATGVQGTSVAYMGPGGFPQAQVTLTWVAPTTSVNGNTLDDFDHYEIWQRPYGSLSTAIRMVGTTTDEIWENSPYIAGSTWWMSVKVVDTSGNRSALSTETSVGMATDATAPQAPTAPIVTANLGVVRIYWDGLPSTGSWAPDLDYVEVHTSQVNNFTPSTGTLYDTLYGEGPAVYTGQPYGVPLYAKLIAVDTSGNKSVPSAQGSASTSQLVNTDLINSIVDSRLLAPGAVTSAAIANLAVGTANMQDLSVVTAKIGNLAVNDAKIANLSVGKLTAGTLSADVLVAARLMTASSGSRVEMNSTGLRMFNGTNLTGWWNPAVGQLRIYNTTDASHTSTGHGLQFGDDNGANLIIDNNEVMSRNNGTYGTLMLNREGGSVLIGGIQGGFPTGNEPIPLDVDHQVQIRGHVSITDAHDGDYADEYPPLSVGSPSGSQHLWFDSNEFGSSLGDVPADMYVQPPLQNGTHHFTRTIFGSNSIMIRRVSATSGNAVVSGWDPDHNISLQFYKTGLLVRSYDVVGYQPITASAFTLSSQEVVKDRVSDIPNPLAIVANAKSHRWQYRSSIESDDRWHYGPMLEDLPAEMRRSTGMAHEGEDAEELFGYDLGSLVGILWEAVRVLSLKVKS